MEDIIRVDGMSLSNSFWHFNLIFEVVIALVSDSWDQSGSISCPDAISNSSVTIRITLSFLLSVLRVRPV